jgi:CRP/FNR family transcriptional regulator
LTTPELKSNSTLRDIPLFSELSIEQLRNLSSISKLKRFKKHERIFNENDIYMGFYILLKGTIKVYKISSSGKESVVHIVTPLTVFADIPLFEGTDYPVTAEALEECLAMFIAKSKFLKLIQSDPQISLKMLGGFAKRLKSLVIQLEDITSMEVPNRLAKYILKEIKISGKEKLVEPFIKLSVPKSTIASYLGTITETLSRNFKKLQKDEIIRVVGKKIFVKDIKRLKELAR